MIITNFRGVSSKNSNFVEKLMIRIIFVVDVLREYAHSRKIWRHSVIWII